MTAAFLSGLDPDDTFAVLADAARTAGALGAVVCTWPQGRRPLLTMPHTDQAYVILAGNCVLAIDDRSFEAGPGSFAFVPRGSRLGIRVVETSCRVLVVLVPAGPEAYLAADSALPGISPATLIALAADHGVLLHPDPIDTQTLGPGRQPD